ncbi:MAG TPA: hypothetical protein PLW97_00530 [Synergistaceae bacterium]|nr:hypothetical protein [Synergistaceae bacterium]HPQ36115.1 hypothetical protein [Synergistaceae bacterium]
MNRILRTGAAVFAGLFFFSCCLLWGGATPSWAISFPWWKGDPPSFKEAWDTTMDKLDDALELLDEHDSLPEKKMMGRDKVENDEEIEDILESLVLMLSDTKVARLRKEAQKLRDYRAETEAEIAEYEEKMLMAPEEGSFLKKSREDLREKIAELREEVTETDEVLEQCRQAIVASLEESGISISEEDVKGLLVSVTGDDILGMYGVYQNIRAFSDAMGELLSKESGSPNIAKRYYGVYALLIRTCIVMNDRFVEKIDSRYFPALGDLEKQALKLRNEAKEHLRQGGLSGTQQKTLESNIRSNTLTLTVILQYRNYLESQKRDSLKARNSFERDYAVALNSYKTVALSSSLLDMIRTNQKEFEALASLDLPEMLLFDNEAMWKEFEQISRTLGK